MRKTWDDHFLAIALECATMSTCIRRHVGAVLVSNKKKILATGFNGVPHSWSHCDPNSGTEPNGFDVVTCEGANEPPGLTDRGGGSKCVSNHAEANALLNCTDKDAIWTCYTTTNPCVNCIKLLLCTGAKRIVFLDQYPGTESRELWLREITANREWSQHVHPASVS